MMDNKFMNLKKEYREFVKKTAIQIKTLNIDEELTKKKCSEIFGLYQTIYSSINGSSLNINDINHIITDYNRDNEDVEFIKKFIKIKNMYLIKRIIVSPQWKPFILKLSESLQLNNKKIDKKIDKKTFCYLLEKGVYRLLLSTINQFRGCWEIADFDNDKLKKIEIIEPDHIEFLTKYIINKIKKINK